MNHLYSKNKKLNIHQNYDMLVNQVDIFAEEELNKIDIASNRNAWMFNARAEMIEIYKSSYVHAVRMHIIAKLESMKASDLCLYDESRRCKLDQPNGIRKYSREIKLERLFDNQHALLIRVDVFRMPGQNRLSKVNSYFNLYLLVFDFGLSNFGIQNLM